MEPERMQTRNSLHKRHRPLLALFLAAQLGLYWPLLQPAFADGGEVPEQLHVTTFLMEHRGVSEKQTLTILHNLDDDLRRNARLDLVSLDTRLADFAQEIPQDEISQAAQAIKDGQEALTAIEPAKAAKLFEQAVLAYSKVLPYIKKQELADAMMMLAWAQFELGEASRSHATLLRLLTWRPDYQLNTTTFPPSLGPSVERARREVSRAARGAIEITSAPAGAQVYVDGRYVGVTPTSTEGLPVGEHWVTLKKEGFRKAVESINVSAQVMGRVESALERSKKYLLVEQALKTIGPQIGKPELDPRANDLKEILFIDQAVFINVLPGQGKSLIVRLSLYDLRNHRLLKNLEKTVPTSGLMDATASLGTDLYSNVSYDAEPVAPALPAVALQVRRRPFYKTWWFWTVTGAVVAGVTVGAILAPKPRDCGGNFCVGISY